MVGDRQSYCGGAGCGGILMVLALLVVASGGLAYRLGTHWPYRVLRPYAPGVILHHTATGASAGDRIVDVDAIDQSHDRRGWGISDGHQTYHIGYHFVILPDGTVQRGRPEWMPGAHTSGHNRYLGVCLVGNFSSKANPNGGMEPDRPTIAQLDALDKLLRELMGRHKFSADKVYGHSEFGATECPGDRFDIDQARRRLSRAIHGNRP
jgi:N-acetylmuramoyl-L-alanine amidase